MHRARFLWTDAWFLTALGACDGGPCALARVIAMGDAIQHAIMTREEVNGALGRLGRAGYVVRHPDGSLEITDAGRSLVADAATAGGLRAQQDRIERFLAAEPWTAAYDPHRAADGEVEILTEEAFASAVARYTSRGLA